MTTFYGQYGQDSIIDAFFQQQGTAPGFYVDIGASDGIRFSNTYFLASMRKWHDICVEVHPDYYKLLAVNRDSAINYRCAVGDKDEGMVPIRLNYRASLTSLDLSLDDKFAREYEGYYAPREVEQVNGFANGITEVPVRTIDSILEENAHSFTSGIDVFCIDIDGSEKFAFPGFTLSKWKPRILLLEHTAVGHEVVDSFARKAGYIKCKTLGSDNFYVLTLADADAISRIEPSKELKKVPHPAG
jgi:FkbM family methyltransferase